MQVPLCTALLQATEKSLSLFHALGILQAFGTFNYFYAIRSAVEEAPEEQTCVGKMVFVIVIVVEDVFEELRMLDLGIIPLEVTCENLFELRGGDPALRACSLV